MKQMHFQNQRKNITISAYIRCSTSSERLMYAQFASRVQVGTTQTVNIFSFFGVFLTLRSLLVKHFLWKHIWSHFALGKYWILRPFWHAILKYLKFILFILHEFILSNTGLEELKILVHVFSCTPIQVCVHVVHAANFVHVNYLCMHACTQIVYATVYVIMYFT